MQPGIQTLKELENSLTHNAAVWKYPELNEEDLKVHLAMFKNKQGQHNFRFCACFERNAP